MSEDYDEDLMAAIAPKSDQLNADDLIAGPKTVTITRVRVLKAGSEQPVHVFYEGDEGKPYKPCKSMVRVMVHLWGPKKEAYTGRRITLHRDPKVSFSGIETGGIRISHMSHIDSDKKVPITQSKSKRGLYTVRKMEEAGPKQRPEGSKDNSAAVESTMRAIASSTNAAGVDAVESALKETAAEWSKEERRKVWNAIKAKRAELGAG